ncbi:DUF4249 domain-containing protein [Aquimarina spongiae]|uniref:DUF4249 domain-containing protein n=1 Tax=Aquimarina spongiae TaxID=570521 RepID=A0A1M6G9Z2_9FLAO|nr:DUF4249 domain-containing protein [Aquimarina spongiae]SHJ06677.1 protein of unknown function [Aquimarina spongiae]
MISRKYTYRLLILTGIVQVSGGCVEEFEFGTQNFEDILVVESTITNELKSQKVSISRTFRLENEGPVPEQNARVSILDNQGTTYTFVEENPGVYLSSSTFTAESGRSYQLQITTQDEKSYASQFVTLPQVTQIDNIKAERVINDQGVAGVGILVDSFDPTGNANFYRYEFEETYQIIPPFFSCIQLAIISNDPPVIDIAPRTREERVCYRTDISNSIILNTTGTLAESNVKDFVVRFIPPDDAVLRNRYSILVKQFVQSAEAYEFYETLSNFSDSESLFTQIQPGFIEGNVQSVDNPDESVLGFFEAASVSTARVFVNLKDVLPGVFRPDFQVRCALLNQRGVTDNEIREIIRLVEGGFRLFTFDATTNVYSLATPICTDCNVLGTNVRPDFWED